MALPVATPVIGRQNTGLTAPPAATRMPQEIPVKIALIGPPLSGKSTLFSAVTHQPSDPAKALQENTAIIKVPDERLDYLTKLYKPKKTTVKLMKIEDRAPYELKPFRKGNYYEEQVGEFAEPLPPQAIV